jgi:hypothetical protein
MKNCNLRTSKLTLSFILYLEFLCDLLPQEK